MTLLRGQDDEDLLRQLSEAVRGVGRVPQAVLTAGRAAFACRTAEAGLLLASLRYDSLLDDMRQFRAGTDSGRRIVTFDAGTLSLEIEVTARRIVGQLIPAAPGQVTMVTLAGGAAQTATDDLGRFLFPRLPPGPVRFRCRSEECSFVTDWVHL